MMTETVPKMVLITSSPLPSEVEEGEPVEDSELEVKPPKPSISHHKKKKKKKSKNPLPAPEKEEDDEELDWEKEGDKSSPSLSEFTIKNVTDARPSSSKRLAVNDGKRTSDKKAKVKGVVTPRLWTQAEEVSLLKIALCYLKDKGAEPFDNMMLFYPLVNIDSKLTNSQIYEKLRKLKEKFVRNVEKGVDFCGSKPLDAEIFRLSQEVWGNGKKVEEEDIEVMYPHLCFSFDDKVASAGVLKYLFETLSLMDRSKAKELEEEWIKLDEMEAKVLFKKTLLMTKQMKLLKLSTC